MSSSTQAIQDFHYDHEKVTQVIESTWPEIFGDKYVPLQIGITAKMWKVVRAMPSPLTKQELKEYLRLHCTSPGYRACLAKGGDRFGLDGLVAGVVSKSQQSRAISDAESGASNH